MTISEQAEQGMPLTNTLVIDAHNHLGRWNAFHIPGGGTLEQMIAKMDRLGIDRICVTAMMACGPDMVQGNDLVAEALGLYPDRIIGYVTLNPNYPEEAREEMARCFKNPGFMAIKIHPGLHGRAIDDPVYDWIYEEAAQRQCPVLVHVWGTGGIREYANVCAAHPETSLIMAHTGGNPDVFPLAAEVLNRYDNAYGDLAVSSHPEGNIEWYVDQVDPHKLLFGTDMPFYDPVPTLGRLALASIPEETKYLIFGQNMARLLHLAD